jgi:hypothetical protein
VNFQWTLKNIFLKLQLKLQTHTIIFSFLLHLHCHSILPLFILVGAFNAPHTNLTQNPKYFLTYYMPYQFRHNILTISSFNCMPYHFRQTILHFPLSLLSFQILSISCKFCWFFPDLETWRLPFSTIWCHCLWEHKMSVNLSLWFKLYYICSEINPLYPFSHLIFFLILTIYHCKFHKISLSLKVTCALLTFISPTNSLREQCHW